MAAALALADDAGGKGEERWRKTTFGLLLAVRWLEGGTVVVINVVVSALSRPLAERMLEMALLVSQLLPCAMVLCLWRALLVYLIRQVTRLGCLAS